jgi:hypothetical protein
MVAEGGAILNPRDELRHGVSFDAWAFVHAGLGDGLSEEELIAHLGIDEERWRAAEDAFQVDLLDDVEAGGIWTEAFDEAMRAARKKWSRRIPPLDVDLRAWLDFQRAWAGAQSPMDVLAIHGLRATDIHRLEEHWQERLAADEALQREALAIRQEPPGPAPTPRPEPVRLPSAGGTVEGADVTAGAVARSHRAPLPFAAGAGAPPPPKLSVPLPKVRRVDRPGTDETRVAGVADVAELVLPFLAPEPRAEGPAPAEPVELREGARPDRLSIERYAALCVDLIEAPDAHAAVLLRYGITPAEKLALDVHWTQRMAEDPATWLAWDRASTQHRAARAT